MRNALVFYYRLPSLAKYLLFAGSVLYAYHFIIYHIRKPARKHIIFWQIVVYFIFATAAFYYLKYFMKPLYRDIFLNLYAERLRNLLWEPLLNDSMYSLPLIPITFVVKRYLLKLIMPKKDMKHGPTFQATLAKEEGIEIGHFDREVLPEQVRQFTPKTGKQLILPFNRLSKGITILGDMGTGKSRLMYALHDGIRSRYPNIPVLIHDPKGEWLRTFYNPESDLIFSPYDRRSCSWSIWKDFNNHPEIKHSVIAAAIESHHSGNSDRFWSDSSVTILKDIATEKNITDAKDSIMKRRDANMSDKTFQSILATLLIGFRDLAIVELGGISTVTPKSIDDFLKHPGRIFLLNNPCCSAEQHGALTLFLTAFLLRSLSLPDVKQDQLQAAVFIDEALTFHLPHDVERAVYSQSRSKGLCIVASAQRLPDAHHSERGGWSNGAAHMFGMRVSDMATRSSLSQRLGNVMYDEEQHSVSRGKDTTKTSSAVLRQHAALAPEDFGSLKNRQFILFHETGIAPGVVIDNQATQREEISTLEYLDRQDVVEFMSEL